MITNFHTPKSTLIMMIAAFAGRDFVMQADMKKPSKRIQILFLRRCNVDFVRIILNYFLADFIDIADELKSAKFAKSARVFI